VGRCSPWCRSSAKGPAVKGGTQETDISVRSGVTMLNCAYRTGHEFVRARPRARKKSPPKNFHWYSASAITLARHGAARRRQLQTMPARQAPDSEPTGHQQPAPERPSSPPRIRQRQAGRLSGLRSTGSATARTGRVERQPTAGPTGAERAPSKPASGAQGAVQAIVETWRGASRATPTERPPKRPQKRPLKRP
jgi:hypothetical protein